MGPGASPHHLRRWCAHNGICIPGDAEGPSFIVEFMYEDEAYTLSASYDGIRAKNSIFVSKAIVIIIILIALSCPDVKCMSSRLLLIYLLHIALTYLKDIKVQSND
ncbi:unnamed protein product [Trichobilharzia regenti]|nr:unnamed protein product [Trichobilharzia regenti]